MVFQNFNKKGSLNSSTFQNYRMKNKLTDEEVRRNNQKFQQIKKENITIESLEKLDSEQIKQKCFDLGNF